MVIDPGLLNLINIVLTVAGGMYGARLLYRQIIAKNTGDATKTLSETIVEQNTLIEHLQDRNTAMSELYAACQTQKRNLGNTLAFMINRYKAYAPLDKQADDLDQMARMLHGESGPTKAIIQQ